MTDNCGFGLLSVHSEHVCGGGVVRPVWWWMVIASYFIPSFELTLCCSVFTKTNMMDMHIVVYYHDEINLFRYLDTKINHPHHLGHKK